MLRIQVRITEIRRLHREQSGLKPVGLFGKQRIENGEEKRFSTNTLDAHTQFNWTEIIVRVITCKLAAI